MRRYTASFVVLGFVLSTIVSWADEGHTNTCNATASASGLYTKVFRVDPTTFAQGLASTRDIHAGSVAAKMTGTDDELGLIKSYFTAAGVDLAPPKILFFNDRLGELMVRGSLKDLEIIAQAVEVLNQAPPQLEIEAKFVEIDEATLQGLGLSWTKPAKEFTAVLTDAQFRSALAAIKPHADFLSLQRVATLSGRQTHIISSIAGRTAAVDVVPTVSADGFSVQMILISTLLKLMGYEQVASTAPQAAAHPLPHFRVSEAVTTRNVWDGQTVVIGRMAADQLPGTGKADAQKVRMVFVTATIIDPAGNRVHADEDMPFTRDTIPPQP